MIKTAGQGRLFSAHASRTRSVFLAAAFTALSLLLLTPVCDAFAAQAAYPQSGSLVLHDEGVPEFPGSDGNHDSSGCCFTIEDSTLVKPADSIASGEARDVWSVPDIPFARVAMTAPHFRPDPVPGALPPPPSFYARSARIRR
jgi:hypothetical protein